jgi:hypothetical protein
MQPDSQLTPRQLFRLYDRGEVNRQQLRDTLHSHAQLLIAEMVEAKAEPQASWIESMQNRLQATALVRKYGEPILREVFVALSEMPHFPAAHYLWNADHPTMPLDCFLRNRREPLFRVIKLQSAAFIVTLTIEHGTRKSPQRETLTLERDRSGQLIVTGRQVH